MVRTSAASKSTKTPVAAAAGAAPAVKKAAATKATPPTPAVVEDATKDNEPGVDDNKMIVETSETTTKLMELAAQLQQATIILAATKNGLKAVGKSHQAELKAVQKLVGKKKKRDGSSRKPSGFNIPTLISDELATFLGKPAATKMARVEVTNAFNTYIKANSLHDPTNGRYIIPDAALTRLLKLTPEDRLSYFNLQAFIKHHFIKETVVVV